MGLLLALTSACKQDSKGSDSNRMLGGDGSDGSGTSADGGVADGGGGASGADGGVTGSDAGADAPVACDVDLLTLDVARDTGPTFAAAVHGNDVHLVHLVATCGGSASNNNAQGLSYVKLATTGAAGQANEIVNTQPPLDCQKTRYPALVSHDDGVVELFYSSNSPGTYELLTKTLGVDTAPVQETSDTDNEVHLAAGVLAPLEDVMVAYANEPPTTDPEPVQIVTQQPGKVESEVAPLADGYHVAQLGLSGIGRSKGNPMGAVAWVSDREQTWGIYYRAIDDIGAGVGDVVELSGDIGGASNVDLAAQPEGGAVVYTVAPSGTFGELRFRAIDEDGVVGSEVKLTRANQNVRDVSIAPYAEGYVIAYRWLGTTAGSEPSMRLMFVDAQGRKSGERLVADATSGGTDSDVFVAQDGRIVLVWGDILTAEGSGAPGAERRPVVRVARVTCM